MKMNESVGYVLPHDVLEIIKNLKNELKNANVDFSVSSKPTTSSLLSTEQTGWSCQPNASCSGEDDYRIRRSSSRQHNHYNKNQSSTWQRNTIVAPTNSTQPCDPPMIPFKITKMEVKEGVEKHINDIRVNLNKMTENNYNKQLNLIVDKLNLIKNEHLGEMADNDDDNHPRQNMDVQCSVIGDIIYSPSHQWHEKIAKIMFEIVSSNKFFSVMYANLFKELINVHNFAFVKTMIDDHLIHFKSTIDHIEYIDPNTDYDGYCRNTKTNDKRKALCLFFVNLAKNGVLIITEVCDILNYFLKKSAEFIDMENKNNEVEEITENIHVMVKDFIAVIRSSPQKDEGVRQWNDEIMPSIMKMSKMKSKEHLSLSNRVVFKYMDILDAVK